MKKFIALSLSDVVIIMLVKDKMPTVVGILIFMSRKTLCSVELSMKSFITSGPLFIGLQQCSYLTIRYGSRYLPHDTICIVIHVWQLENLRN